MQTQNISVMQTSGQVGPKSGNIERNRSNTMLFIINGCAVSVSVAEGTDDPINAVKEILLSAYRTRITNR